MPQTRRNANHMTIYFVINMKHKRNKNKNKKQKNQAKTRDIILF